MVTKELTNYISKAKHSGQSNEQITQTLTRKGWSMQDIQAELSTDSTPQVEKMGAATKKMTREIKLGIKIREKSRPVVQQLMQATSVADEQLTDFSQVREQPAAWTTVVFWGLLFPWGYLLWAFLIKASILVLTNKRLLIIHLTMFNKPKSYTDYNRGEIRYIDLASRQLGSELILEVNGGKRKFTFLPTKFGTDEALTIASNLSGSSQQKLLLTSKKAAKKRVLIDIISILLAFFGIASFISAIATIMVFGIK